MLHTLITVGKLNYKSLFRKSNFTRIKFTLMHFRKNKTLPVLCVIFRETLVELISLDFLKIKK